VRNRNADLSRQRRGVLSPATLWNIAGFHGDLSLSALLTPDGRHALVFEGCAENISVRPRLQVLRPVHQLLMRLGISLCEVRRRLQHGRALSEDVSENYIAREIMRRTDLADEELPAPLEDFVELHVGPERQLILRLE
jgi:hypothetical protein